MLVKPFRCLKIFEAFDACREQSCYSDSQADGLHGNQFVIL